MKKSSRYSSLWAVPVGALWTLLCACSAICGFLINRRLGHWVHRSWGKGFCRIFAIRLTTEGLEHLPATGGYILAPNHQSLCDIPILATLPVNFRWVAKSSIAKVPFLGGAMRRMGCFFLKRDKSSRDLNVLHEVEKELMKGERFLIFPEGTRTRNGERLPVKKGAFRACFGAHVPLVPVLIRGSFEIAVAGTIPRTRGHDVLIRVGPPILASPETSIPLYVSTLARLDMP